MRKRSLINNVKSNLLDKKWLILCMALYKLSLELCYVFVMSPRFSVSLMTTNMNWAKFVLSVVFMVATLAAFPKNYSRPSTYLYGLMYVLIFVPTVSYFWLNDQAVSYILVEMLCFALIAVGLQVGKQYRGLKLPCLKLNRKLGAWFINALFLAYIVTTIALIVQNGGLDIRTFSWSEVYQVRAENNISGIWGYLLNWCAKSFMPFFFAYFLMRREYVGMACVCVLQCLTFMVFGFKAFLMAVALIIGVSFLMEFDQKKFNHNMAGILSVGTLVVSVLDRLGITDLGMLLLPYRTLMLPAQGQYEYYVFFKNHDYLHFSEGLVGRLLGIEYPYDDQIGRIINMYFYGLEKQSNGNTGIFSYGFADAGFAGMILAAAIIMVILIVVDRSTKKLPVVVPVAAMAYQMFVLNDNSIFISLNTGGILWTVALLMTMNWAYPAINTEKRLPMNRFIDKFLVMPLRKLLMRVINKAQLWTKLCVRYLFPKVLSKAQLSSFRNCEIHKTARVDCKCALTSVNMGRYSYVGSGSSITYANIGSFCSIAGGCQIGGGEHPLDTVSSSPVFLAGRNILGKNFADFAYEPARLVEIGSDVWIGSNAYIKGGVKIGTGAVIGAHAVVTKDVAPYEIVAGCPAKVLRKRFDEDTVAKLLALEWWEWPEEKLEKYASLFNDPRNLLNEMSGHD